MLVLHSKSKTALAKTQQPMGPVALKAMRWTLTTLSCDGCFSDRLSYTNNARRRRIKAECEQGQGGEPGDGWCFPFATKGRSMRQPRRYLSALHRASGKGQELPAGDGHWPPEPETWRTVARAMQLTVRAARPWLGLFACWPVLHRLLGLSFLKVPPSTRQCLCWTAESAASLSSSCHHRHRHLSSFPWTQTSPHSPASGTLGGT